ncbi:hypothetical protein ACJMK2_033304, partial [Sinanodonta woodiana]
SQIKASPLKQDAASGKVYEGFHFTEVDESQYHELNDIALEGNRHANIRPPENDSYETLHQHTNNDNTMYSSSQRSQIKASPLKQDAASRKVHEGLHFTEVDESQYHELN